MQMLVVIVSLILSVIGLICIHLKNYMKERHILNAVKHIVVPGAVAGALVCILAIRPITSENIISGALLGILCGEVLYILCQVAESILKEQKFSAYYDDGVPPKFFITGDKHRNFSRVKDFCRNMNTRRKDVLIILGDAGLNYYGDLRDDRLKKELSKLNITLFCLHGNKENRPQNVGTYGIRNFCGGRVFYEPKYPNLYFAIDGEIYTFEGKKYMVVGGAHSVDKIRCLEENRPFWEDEMPNDVIKARVEKKLAHEYNKIYGIMTHTCPIKYLPKEMFISTRQNASVKKRNAKKPKKTFKPDIDRSTEEWLGKLEKRLDYQVWYCGHYHIDKQIDKINMICHEIQPLHMSKFGDE